MGKHLIIAHEIENAAITALGSVDVNCHSFVDDYFESTYAYGWRHGIIRCKDMEKIRPGQLIVLVECRHVRISKITIERCLNIAQFCTAYNSKGCADIEDFNFNGISAAETDRCFEVFARNGATVRNVTMENIRTTDAP